MYKLKHRLVRLITSEKIRFYNYLGYEINIIFIYENIKTIKVT